MSAMYACACKAYILASAEAGPASGDARIPAYISPDTEYSGSFVRVQSHLHPIICRSGRGLIFTLAAFLEHTIGSIKVSTLYSIVLTSVALVLPVLSQIWPPPKEILHS